MYQAPTSYKAPTSPYEAAWQQWNYGGGASRGEPMPRIQDYPDTFEEDLSGGPMATDMGESVKQGKYDRGGDLRELPGDEFDPSGGGTIYYPPGQRMEQMQPDYATAAPSPASPDGVYGALMPTRPYAPMPARPGMVGAMGNAMGRPGMANAVLGGPVGSAIRKNPGLLKRLGFNTDEHGRQAAGGLMGAMTLAQLNRRKGY